jgi:signal transduction histidine kinase
MEGQGKLRTDLFGRLGRGIAAVRVSFSRALGISARRQRAVEAAIAEERRRIARDLHDGLAQELAFISMQTRAVADRTGHEAAVQLAEAAERALAESRHAIEALSAPSEQSLGAAVSETAERLTTRSGASLALNLDRRAEASPEIRVALLRIVREAVWNGIRHGSATAFEVELSAEDSLRLRISDNGGGFDPERLNPGRQGLGLASMRERARALGGKVGVRSQPGAGTEVEVVLP